MFPEYLGDKWWRDICLKIFASKRDKEVEVGSCQISIIFNKILVDYGSKFRWASRARGRQQWRHVKADQLNEDLTDFSVREELSKKHLHPDYWIFVGHGLSELIWAISRHSRAFRGQECCAIDSYSQATQRGMVLE